MEKFILLALTATKNELYYFVELEPIRIELESGDVEYIVAERQLVKKALADTMQADLDAGKTVKLAVKVR